MHPAIRRALAVVAPAAVALSLLTPSVAQAETVASGPYTAVFNYPTVNGPDDFSISSHLNGLIDLADSGTLYMSMFWLNNSTGIQDRLLAAQARGVTLKISVEKSFSGSLDTFASKLTSSSSLTLCQNSCLNVVTGGHQSGVAVALAPTGRLSLTYSDDYDQNGFNEMRLRDGFLNR
ncbi:hypothetical protein OG373_06305 [Streptomyces avidinii]|uniref:hypothetical protein n=1 Tax=Streptomyces avidinii TaxID=1895 RepID=UPI00386419BB|nr:hypothetical protein OG373_06305 [Streptomyces avidinii]